MLPLVSAGEMHVRAPYTIEKVREMAGELMSQHGLLHEINAARAKALAQVVIRPSIPEFGFEELCISASIHNILFLSHPRASSLRATDKQYRRVLGHAKLLAEQSKATTVGDAMDRHSLIASVFRIRRADVKLSWWTGVASFQGQQPPKRLTTFRGLRRVTEETEWVGFSKLFASPDARRILTLILRDSPLTQLLAVHTDSPVLHWEDAAFLLRHSEICRAVCANAVVVPDLEARYLGPARYMAAFEQMLERSPEESDVRAVTAFLVYLNLLLALEDGANPRFWDFFLPEHAGKRSKGLTLWAALPRAARRVDPRLSKPAGLSKNMTETWMNHRERLKVGVGNEVVEHVEQLLRKHLRAQLPAA